MMKPFIYRYTECADRFLSFVGWSAAPSTCSNGIVGVQSSDGYGNVCCSVECTECGGDGCANYGAGKDNCCVSEIYENGGLCSTLGEAPCIIYDGELLFGYHIMIQRCYLYNTVQT